MTVTVSGHIADVTGRPDNTRWHFSTPRRVREGSVDGSIITSRQRSVQPLDGEISVDLEPGRIIIEFGDEAWEVVVPESDANLWDLIATAVGVPPETGAMFMANVASPPATPTGGGVLYVESGSLKFKGSGGTVTVLGPA